MEVALGAGEANDAIAVLRDAMRFAGASPVLLAHCGALAAGAIRGRRAPSTAQTTLTDRNLLLSVRYRELKNFADKRLPITFQEPIVAGEGGGSLPSKLGSTFPFNTALASST